MWLRGENANKMMPMDISKVPLKVAIRGFFGLWAAKTKRGMRLEPVEYRGTGAA